MKWQPFVVADAAPLEWRVLPVGYGYGFVIRNALRESQTVAFGWASSPEEAERMARGQLSQFVEAFRRVRRAEAAASTEEVDA